MGFDGMAIGGVSVRGAAPGTRETDFLRPGNLVETVNAVVLSGGSAFGLDAASGVMRYLEQMDSGMDMGVARVPIVPAAGRFGLGVLYDLGVGDPLVRPDAAMGRAACMNAGKGMQQGRVGAGTGAAFRRSITRAPATARVRGSSMTIAFLDSGNSSPNIRAADSVAPGPITHAFVSVVCVNASSIIVISLLLA